MRLLKIMALLAMIASLFGCGEKGTGKENDKTTKPFMLDGPGMEYVDSDYRTEYANCLPFEDVHGSPYLAVAYLGNGEDGKRNREIYLNKIFESLDDERISQIKTYEYGGEDWFLVIPRYRSLVDLKKGDEEARRVAECGEAFVVRCNQDVVVNIFEVTDIYYKLSVDENGKLENTGENVWNITEIDDIIK